MPAKQLTPTIAENRGSARDINRNGCILTVTNPYAPIPRPEPADDHGHHSKSRCKVDCRKQCCEYKHRALKKVYESPLRLIIRIFRVVEPGVADGVYEIYYCLSPRRTYLRARNLQPVGVRVSCCFVCTKLADEPADDGGRGGWEEEPEGPSECADGEVGQCCFDIALPG